MATKIQFASDTERRNFVREWEKTRKEILKKTQGHTILLSQGASGIAEYREDLGYIANSKVGKGKGPKNGNKA